MQLCRLHHGFAVGLQHVAVHAQTLDISSAAFEVNARMLRAQAVTAHAEIAVRRRADDRVVVKRPPGVFVLPFVDQRGIAHHFAVRAHVADMRLFKAIFDPRVFRAAPQNKEDQRHENKAHRAG